MNRYTTPRDLTTRASIGPRTTTWPGSSMACASHCRAPPACLASRHRRGNRAVSRPLGSRSATRDAISDFAADSRQTNAWPTISTTRLCPRARPLRRSRHPRPRLGRNGLRCCKTAWRTTRPAERRPTRTHRARRCSWLNRRGNTGQIRTHDLFGHRSSGRRRPCQARRSLGYPTAAAVNG